MTRPLLTSDSWWSFLDRGLVLVRPRAKNWFTRLFDSFTFFVVRIPLCSLPFRTKRLTEKYFSKFLYFLLQIDMDSKLSLAVNPLVELHCNTDTNVKKNIGLKCGMYRPVPQNFQNFEIFVQTPKGAAPLVIFRKIKNFVSFKANFSIKN